MIRDSQHELVFGSLLPFGEWSSDGWVIEVLADDATWGNPQPIEVAVKSLLQDGSIVATTGHDNREAFVRVTLKSSDGIGLALAEAALNAEVGKLNLLTWTPPDGFGPPTVFPVVTSSLEHTFDDMGELRLERTYGLRLVCEPFGRSVAETTAVPTGAVETFGTARQQRRVYEVGGSTRTQAAIEVGASTALGWTLVYAGYGDGVGAIPLRPYLTSSQNPAVADAALVSGAYNSSDAAYNGVTFTIPASQLNPGTYAVFAMMKSSATRTAFAVRVTTRSLMPGSGYGGDIVGSEFRDFHVDLATTWRPQPLMLLNLPPSRATGSSGSVSVSIWQADSAVDWQIDEAWLFNVDTGAVTVVENRNQRLWINPASTETGVPSIIVGNAADGSDSFDLYRTYVSAWGAHTFPPGSVEVFTATAGATDSTAALRYHKRWHTHAAE